MSDSLDATSFNQNFKVLKDTADWLSQQKEPDIDQLVPRVEMAMHAYKACKTRLDAVQTTLARHFEQDGTADGVATHGDGKTEETPFGFGRDELN